MFKKEQFFILKTTLVLFLTFNYSAGAMAGFLDMPEVEETRELERKSLLRDMDIPSVRERDPDPQAGPRLDVREFRIQGLIEYPKLGITREAIIKQVESIRFDMMAEGEKLESGYTIDELAELSDLIAEIEEETGEEHVGSLEVQRLVFLIREQRRRRGITLGMIETVADTITQYYRERGFILAKAYIPEQRVRDGIVNLTLLLGSLGEVAVVNNKSYRNSILVEPFNSMMGQPVTNTSVEERLYLINDLPGLSAQGYFEPGSQVGDTKLNLNIQNEEPFLFNVRTDNHGGEQNGEYRVYTDMQWNNPTGFADQVSLALLYATEPGSTLYGSARYSLSLFSPRLIWEMGVSNNAFELGKGNSEQESGGINLADFFQLHGESTVYDVGLKWKHKRSRTNNYSWLLSYEKIESYIDDEEGVYKDLYKNTVDNIKFGFEFDVLQESDKELHQGSIDIIAGSLSQVIPNGLDESFLLLRGDYTLLSFAKIPFSSLESRLITRISAQFSGAKLGSASQFGLGGPIRARGFATNEFFADDGISLSTDWVLNSLGFGSLSLFGRKYSDIIQPFLFIDAGFGRNNPRTELEGEQTAQLGDIGFGLKFNAGQFRGNFQIAMPMIGEINQESLSSNNGETALVEITTDLNDEPRFYFDFQYSF